MANKALFWYNYKRFVDEGTIKPLSPKTFALSGLITVCGLMLSLTIYCLGFSGVDKGLGVLFGIS